MRVAHLFNIPAHTWTFHWHDGLLQQARYRQARETKHYASHCTKWRPQVYKCPAQDTSWPWGTANQGTGKSRVGRHDRTDHWNLGEDDWWNRIDIDSELYIHHHQCNRIIITYISDNKASTLQVLSMKLRSWILIFVPPFHHIIPCYLLHANIAFQGVVILKVTEDIPFPFLGLSFFFSGA